MTDDMKQGDRIAKVLARAGVSSRREAERLISIGAVAVNGQVIDSPALNIGPKDRVTVNGRPIGAAEPPRLWLYYKPLGLVTTERDEKGRETVFESLPEDMPRVISVGRLDLNSEGLLLLTNDGEIKRRLELPSTGWLRKYRVRVNGRPQDGELEPLRQGLEVDGERFLPMQVVLDRQQGANAWLTVGLREGRNREIRRAMEVVGLTVNRLIRLSYGPFRLDDMEPGEVREVKPRVLRDQLGLKEEDGPAVTIARTAPVPKVLGRPSRPAKGAERDLTGAADPSASLRRAAPPKPAPKPAARDDDRPFRPRPGAARDGEAPREGRGPRSQAGAKFGARSRAGDKPGRAPRAEGSRSHRGEAGDDRPARSFKSRPLGEGRDARPLGDKDRPPRAPRPEGGAPRARSFRDDREGQAAPRGERSSRPARSEAGASPERRPRSAEAGEKPARSGYAGRRPAGDDAPRGAGGKPRFGAGDRPRPASGDKPRFGTSARSGAASGDKPRFGGDKPRAPSGDRPRPASGDKPRFGGDKPRAASGDRPRPAFGDKPRAASGGERPRAAPGAKGPREGASERPRSFGKPQGDRPRGPGGPGRNDAAPRGPRGPNKGPGGASPARRSGPPKGGKGPGR